GNGGRFADPAHVGVGPPMIVLYQDRLDSRHVLAARDPVPLEIRVHHPSGSLVELALLEEREGDPLDDAPVDLGLDGEAVHRTAAIVYRHHAEHADHAGTGIDLDLGKLGAADGRRVTVLAPALVVPGALAKSPHHASVELARGGAEVLLSRNELEQLLARLLRRDPYRRR